MGSAGRGCTWMVRAAQRLAERSADRHAEIRRRRSGGTGWQAAAGCQDPGQAQHLVRAVRRGPWHLYRRHRDRFEGPHRVRSAGPDFAAHRAPCAGRCSADQAAEPLQAGRGAQVGGAGVRRFLSRPAQERYRGVPEVLAGQGQWRSDAGNPRRPRRCGGGAFAAPAQHQGRDLRAIGRLGRGRGRGLHQAVRDELDPVRTGQPLSKSPSPPGEGVGAPQGIFRIDHDERVATRQSWEPLQHLLPLFAFWARGDAFDPVASRSFWRRPSSPPSGHLLPVGEEGHCDGIHARTTHQYRQAGTRPAVDPSLPQRAGLLVPGHPAGHGAAGDRRLAVFRRLLRGRRAGGVRASDHRRCHLRLSGRCVRA
ncbi:hypothetical protein XAP7430_1090024 [Xanthomonas phaseoli pv. phaseoli]|uniref:Uncharacterized protein n=1 Tax=Xanthomonas campestris pv. phaseoli TaxID=317013 RepID=A0AB38DWF4_XANCH|nr:hypothetical protein XAP6984_1120024 [Xanthomonas phaseoli pv. phaseoli]SON78803.1 hypothetical protein XAP7430_1090024 [Xanthomonas phaseoli pv. phaseoli]